MLILTFNRLKEQFIKRVVFISVFFVFLYIPVEGQNNIIDYQFSGRSLFFNPALNAPNDKFHISIFPIAVSDFELSSPVSLNDVFKKNLNSSLYELNLGQLGKRLRMKNQFNFNSTIGYLTFSCRWHSSNWGIQIYDNVYSSLSLEKSLVEFLNNGNSFYLNKEFSTDLSFSFQHFNTLQISCSRKLNPKFHYGFSAKLYFGKSTVGSNADISIFTDSKVDYIDVGLSGKFRASGPLIRSINYQGFVNGIAFQPETSIIDYLFEFKNPGLGVDFGFDYRYSDKVKFSASVVDLGFISWLTNINSVTISGSYHWDGFDISNLINYPKDSTVIGNLTNISFADSMLYNAMTPDNKSFINPAPLKVYISANYRLSERVIVSAVNRLSFFDGFVNESFLLSGSFSLNDNWDIYSGICLSNRSWVNLPAGLIFKNERFEFKFSTSNLWGVFLPSYSRTFGGSFQVGVLIDGFSKAEREKMKHLPFFRLYKKWH
jgi:hypothetical protein